MKVWVLVLLSVLSTKAFASVADSGRCPWKIPFTITVQATGIEHRYELARSIITGGWYEHDSDDGKVVTTNQIAITVDTSGAYLADSVKYSLKSNILVYSRRRTAAILGPPASIYDSVCIVFAHAKDSIVSIAMSGGDSTQWGIGQESYNRHNFAISDLAFNDTSIFSSDTSFLHHNVSYTNSYEHINHYTNEYDYDKSFSDFTATAVTLSGIFRPMAFGRGGIGIGCPWKVPFTITIHASGQTSSWGYFTPGAGPGTQLNTVVMPDSQYLRFTIDTNYTLHDDTLRSRGEAANESIVIAFAHGRDSIVSITYTQPLSGQSTSFAIFALHFDSSGIYTTDSSFRHHNTSVTVDESSTNYVGRHDYISSGSRFIATAASLSGIFRPIALQDSAIPFNRLHLPFQIVIHSIGTIDSAGTTYARSKDLLISVWHSGGSGPDTLRFSSGTTTNDSTLELDFVPGTDTISTLRLSIAAIGIVAGPFEEQWYVDKTITTFIASNFVTDGTHVFSSDSSFCNHGMSMTTTNSSQSYSNSTLTSNTSLQFVATSADLSGIFRSTHYACEADVSVPVVESNWLGITSLPKGIHCTFSPSDRSRTMGVYSILGIRAAISSIPAEAAQTTISDLAPGLYFVRLDDQVAKVLIQ